MLSAGMFCAFASAMIVRSRGFMSGSPPPARAATVNSLISRVKILPRLASSAPFLCLIDAHFEWPDISKPPKINGNETKILHLFREDDPHVGAGVPRPPAVVAEDGVDGEAGAFEMARHLRHGQRAKREIEPVLGGRPAAALDVALLERGQLEPRIVAHRLDEREMRAAG